MKQANFMQYGMLPGSPGGKSPYWLAALSLLCFLGGCIEPPPVIPDNAIRIGALLPFNGEASASGPNIEQAMLLGVEQINAAGGVFGRPLALIVRDSSADVDTNLAQVTQLLDQERVSFVIGPENGEVARAMEPIIDARNAVLIAGGITAPTFRASAGASHVFRIVPAPTASANAVARLMYEDGARTLTVVHVDDAYGRDYARFVGEQFINFGGTVLPAISHALSERDFAQVIAKLAQQPSDAVLLVSYPLSAAALVQDALASALSVPWYFGPSLRSTDFIRNTPPGSLNGRKGVSLAVSADAEAFATVFERRWGERPLTESFFYFDALALAALSLQVILPKEDPPSGDGLVSALQAVTATMAAPVAPWFDLEADLQQVSVSGRVRYRGVTGNILFDQNGQVSRGIISIFQIMDGAIAELQRVVL